MNSGEARDRYDKICTEFQDIILEMEPNQALVILDLLKTKVTDKITKRISELKAELDQLKPLLEKQDYSTISTTFPKGA